MQSIIGCREIAKQSIKGSISWASSDTDGAQEDGRDKYYNEWFINAGNGLFMWLRKCCVVFFFKTSCERSVKIIIILWTKWFIKECVYFHIPYWIFGEKMIRFQLVLMSMLYLIFVMVWGWCHSYLGRSLFKSYTVKPVYNDHLMGYFSAFWSSSRWPRAT